VYVGLTLRLRLSVRLSVSLSVYLSVSSGRHTPLLRVCCCGPGGQEISTDCCTAGAQPNASSATSSADVIGVKLQGSRPPISDLQESSCVDDPQYFDKCFIFSLQRCFWHKVVLL